MYAPKMLELFQLTMIAVTRMFIVFSYRTLQTPPSICMSACPKLSHKCK